MTATTVFVYCFTAVSSIVLVWAAVFQCVFVRVWLALCCLFVLVVQISRHGFLFLFDQAVPLEYCKCSTWDDEVSSAVRCGRWLVSATRQESTFSASVNLQCLDCHYCVWVLFYSCFNHCFGLSGRCFCHLFLSELDVNTPEAMSFFCIIHRSLFFRFYVFF
jgi:hypothetical protein